MQYRPKCITLFRYSGRVWPKVVRKRLYMLSSTLLSIKLVGTRGWCWFLYQRLTVLLQKADSEKPTEKSKQEENNAKYLGALKVTIHLYLPSILHLKWHLFLSCDILTSSLTQSLPHLLLMGTKFIYNFLLAFNFKALSIHVSGCGLIFRRKLQLLQLQISKTHVEACDWLIRVAFVM